MEPFDFAQGKLREHKFEILFEPERANSSSFDRHVLSNQIILRHAQDDLIVEGLRLMN